MTATLTPPELDDAAKAAAEQAAAEEAFQAGHGATESEPEEQVSLRPVIAAGLSTAAAALVVGGIFGSWSARLFGLVVGVGGAALAAWVLRSKRPALAQAMVLPIVGAVAVLSVFPGDSPGDIRRLIGDAVDAGRLLRPPVPFDAGWRPLLVIVLGLLGFGAAWIGSALQRPLLGAALPIPLVGLAAITQPDSEQILAGVFAFLPVLAAFGVLFGAEAGDRTDLGREFEVTRLIRGGAAMVGLAVALVALGHTGFLFPEPTFDPTDRPQKPKSVPLSQARDRVLFTVEAPPGFTGPWRMGVLDIYEDGAWKLPGTNARRFTDFPDSGVLDNSSTASLDERPLFDVSLTTGDLGPTAVLPVVPTASKVRFAGTRPELRLDPRSGGMRVPSGRAPSGVRYTLSIPGYPTAKQLELVNKVTTSADLIEVPPPPPTIQRLLAQAPPGPWARLDNLRHKLLDNVTAQGGGTPRDVTVARVVDLLTGSKKGTPFEIVAAQGLLARWAGIPSRIGYGFNGVNDESGQLTVRPRNAAQWLEVRLDGFGWVPLLDVPPQAQAELDNEREPDRVLPSTDIAVQVFVPIEVENPRLLFERVREALFMGAPFVGVVLFMWLATPIACRLIRRRRRERWADALGPRAGIAVSYAEFRDAATDLSLGDPFATPLEFLDRTQPDGEHTELAWLVSRTLYGDLASTVTDDDARAAEEMSLSLRSRLRQAQPLQVRAIGFLSKGSLLRPYTEEIPNITVPTPLASARLAVLRFLRRIRRSLQLWRRIAPSKLQRAAVLLLIVVLLGGACSAGGAPDTLIGVRKVALSLVFKDEALKKPVPTRVVLTIIPAPPDLLAQFGIRVPAKPMPRAPLCGTAPAGAVPAEPATAAITKPPKEGTYLRRNVGTIALTGGAIPLSLPYPPITKVMVKNVKSEVVSNPYFGDVNVTRFQMVEELTPTLSTIETYSYDFDGLDLEERVFVNDNSVTTFKPTPPVQVMMFAGTGNTWQGAGIDPATGAAMIVQGTVAAKQAVDVCGTLIDTYQSSTTERLVDVVSGNTSGSDADRPILTNYALQLGGLVLKREAHTSQVINNAEGTVALDIDVVSTLLNAEPTSL